MRDGGGQNQDAGGEMRGGRRPIDLASAPDAALEAALRDLRVELAWPAPSTPDLAVRVRVAVGSATPPRRRRPLPAPIRLRRSVLLALAALLVLAAVAAAAIAGVPGIRIVFVPGPAPTAPASHTGSGPGSGPPSASPSTGPSAPVAGASLGLGDPVTIAEAADAAGLEPRLPADPGLGAPDATYLADRRITFVWRSRGEGPAAPALPDLDGAPGVGLLLTEFRGTVNGPYIEKQVSAGTTVERAAVGDAAGWWLAGAPHFFFYVDDQGVSRDETRRLVGRVLIWQVDGVTYRLESPFGRDETIAIAESLAPAR